MSQTIRSSCGPRRRRGLALLSTCLLAVLLASGASLAADRTAANRAGQEALKPTAEQVRTTEQILTVLEEEHYRHVAIDDAFSAQLLDAYLRALDPSHSFFLAADVQEFESYRAVLDDKLLAGNLEPAFAIFNRFQQRRIERFTYLEQALENDLDSLDFSAEESLDVDRRKAPWLADAAEADELWRKRFKNDVLSLELTGKSREETRPILQRRYHNQLVRARQANSDDVFRVFANELTGLYDPHTEYFPPREAANFDIQMSLSVEGIGALLTNDGEYTAVVSIVPGGPADKSGELHPEDRIISVGQGDEELVDVVGWRVDEVVELIRGPKGSRVRLLILPAGQNDPSAAHSVEFVRDEVKLEEQAARSRTIEVESGGRKLAIGIIELPAFYLDFAAIRNGDEDFRSSTRDVRHLLEKLKEEKVAGIVVDLRGNGGGSLTEAIGIASLFLGRGPIVQVRNAAGEEQVLVDPRAKQVYGGPLAILVNRLSASASEILAAAVQDYGRGVVIGDRTFGKGTVQQVLRIDEGQLNLTQAKFYRITGASTQHRGVVPDIPLPALVDPTEIGESALEGALPWDQIRSVDYQENPVIKDLTPALWESHKKRTETDPEFVSLFDELEYSEERRRDTLVSLNAEVRRRERDEAESRLLAIENDRRRAMNLPTVESLEEIRRQSAALRILGEDDLFSKEAARILADLITRSDMPE
ncbi:MAG: carboxy terminal-processing peptidase [Planctomycetota bacterium]